MNSYDRSMRIAKGEAVDRPPVHPLILTFAARLIGKPYREYVSDYRLLVEGQLRTAEKFGIDCITVCSDPCREAADCGAQIRWFEDQPPTQEPDNPLIRERTDLVNLKQPDPLGGGRMHDRVKGVELMREQAGGELQIVGWIEGPIAEAADLRGINNIMIDLIDDPVFVRDLFEFVLEMEVAFARAQVDAGADIIGIGDAAASLVGPRYYRDYVLPYEKRMVDAVHDMGVPMRLHICGNTTDLLSDIATLGVDEIDIDFPTDLRLSRERLGGDVAIMANLNPVRYFLNSTPEQIRMGLAECHRIVGERFVVGAGCEIPPDTPHENMRAMVEYAEACR